MKILSWIGLIVTASYLLAVTAIYIENKDSFSSLGPNEWGDFLSGSFGPLAIFWLIIGFFQQGAELRNSVKSLDLQTKEISRSIEQQKEISEVTKKELSLIEQREMDRRISELDKTLPHFSPHAPEYFRQQGEPVRVILDLVNIGAPATSVFCHANKKQPFSAINNCEASFIPNGGKFNPHVIANSVEGGPEECTFIIVSSGKFGDRKYQRFLLSGNRIIPGGTHIIPASERGQTGRLTFGYQGIQEFMESDFE